MRGRKPKPTMLADLHGRPSKRKAPPNEPKPVGSLLEPPDWLSESQRDGWRYALEHAPPGLLKRIDRGALTVWIAAEDLHRKALIQQSQVGLIVKSPISETPMQSPYLAIINRQGLIMLRAASELGFSPVSRPRVGIMTPVEVAHTEKAAGKGAPRRSLDDFLDDAPTFSVN